MKMRSFLSQINMLCLAIAVATLSFGGNPAHAGPGESVKGSPIGMMGTVTDRVDLNLKRAEAAKRQKERRAAAAAEAAKKADAAKKSEGGAK
jgi:hypothetical protein